MHILAVVGSPRLNGNTNYLAEEALLEAGKLGATTEKIILSEHRLSPCLAHADCSRFESCAQQDDGEWLLDRFCRADAVILATPVYYYDVSAWMKTFIDRNCFLSRHQRKCQAQAVGIIVVAGRAGVEESVATMKRYVNSSSFNRIPEDRVFIAAGYASAPGDASRNEQLLRQAREMGRQLASP